MNEQPNSPLTRLLAAAGRGDAKGVAAILDDHPEIINTRGVLPGNTGLRTALHFGSGHEPVVRLLLARGALDVLGWAVCFEYATHLDVARYLLANGARHTLFSAVAMGDGEAIRALAAAGADLNQRMDRANHRRAPLHLAVVKKQAGALAALIDLGAAIDPQDAVGLTPLDQAALDGEAEMADVLIKAGAAITLPAAIVLERQDDVERLVRENPETLSATNNRQWARLLVHASGRASGRVVEMLLRTAMRHGSGLSIVNMEDHAETAVDGASGYTPSMRPHFATTTLPPAFS